MNILLIRHGKTAGNLEKRYLGTTDEGLCLQGRDALNHRRLKGIYDFPECTGSSAVLWGSPMLRCRETAGLLFPHMEYHTEPDLRECDFGRFEYKNYPELNGSADYQAWVDSGGALPFPEGEDPEEFRRRCCRGFEKILNSVKSRGIHGPDRTKAAAVHTEKTEAPVGDGEPALILVVHGGTIMSIMATFAAEKRDYFDWQPDNGGGYRCLLAEGRLHILQSF